MVVGELWCCQVISISFCSALNSMAWLLGSHTGWSQVLKAEMLTGTCAFESWGSQGPVSLEGYERERTIIEVSQNWTGPLRSIVVWLVTCPGRGGKFFSSGKKWCRWCLCFKSNVQCLQGGGQQGLAGIRGQNVVSMLRFVEIYSLCDKVG